ncbi:hypothetical protein Rxycam_00069 [Rubrobacter xylanophilus DSM 9941]|uniref:bifunctional helix-turn-helix transcriptional regulator/GNAT family N-acetyltransferase n=1 Tax=Rubrobacter xylanophilus TaxID=49319 RepID=UPI00227786F7|nr:bifunctional helix-turn-helix transcriptional regulator/GNAT family N-acetyltransferase [Rubrobacter xylanophilus]QYJ14273.1 hypothetical protein Rxycam_00069 [Rubrobacter xylanophilus DSM 9941]
MNSESVAAHVNTVRRFNRFYTRQLGLLRDSFLRSPFSLPEARVVYELAQHEETTASHLCQELGMDPGYMSRILRRLKRQGFVEKRPSEHDARQYLVSLTEKGQKAFARLNAASRSDIERLLSKLSDEEQRRLVQAMETIEALLGAPPEHRASYILRPPYSGDLGWVVHRHGVLYREEYGWNEEFEALVAEIVARFVQNFDPARERCWIAEMNGENVGSVFLVKKTDTTAQLRLLLVEPKARGLGIGRRLVQECTRFARQAGYSKIVLWTNNVLTVARHIYEREGYRLVKEEPHHSFGRDLVGEYWELTLDE